MSSFERSAAFATPGPRRRCATGLASFAICLAALGGCGETDEADPDEEPQEVVTPVRTAHLDSTSFVDVVRIYGRVQAKERVRITAEIPGRIEGLPFDNGQRVGRGQTVARINARIARAQLAQAEATNDLAQAELTRAQKMLEKKLTTPQQLEMATARARQSEAGLQLSQANLDKAVIRSPIDGMVTNVIAHKGEVANPGAPLLEVVNVAIVDVLAQVAERDVPLIELGTEVSLRIEAYPGASFVGNVQRVGLIAQDATRTFPVEIRVDNADGRLRPGMLASLELTRSKLDNVVVVPRDAVLDDEDGKSAYLAQDGVARRRPVTLGPVRGRFTVVTEGLGEGDEMIVLGHRQVVDGQKISIERGPPCCSVQMNGKSKSATGSIEHQAPPIAADTAAGKL